MSRNIAFAYGSCALALALILGLPPTVVGLAVISLNFDGTWGPMVDFEQRIWCVPFFGPGRVAFSPWIAAFVVWAILAVALVLVAKNRQFRLGPATIVFAVILMVSAAIPTSRGVYLSSDLAPGAYMRLELQESDVKMDQGLTKSSPRVPHARAIKQYVLNTLSSGLIAPTVMATWVLGIFLAAGTGFLVNGKHPDTGDRD